MQDETVVAAPEQTTQPQEPKRPKQPWKQPFYQAKRLLGKPIRDTPLRRLVTRLVVDEYGRPRLQAEFSVGAWEDVPRRAPRG